MTYFGSACSDGIGIGTATVIVEKPLDYSNVVFLSATEENKRLSYAAEDFCNRAKQMAERIEKQVGKTEAEILNGQINILNDQVMIEQMKSYIDKGHTAENAVSTVCDMYIDMFLSGEDRLTKQKISDVSDLKGSMLKILLDIKDFDFSELPPNSVIVARDFTPSMMSRINASNIVGIVTEIGERTSNAAILARALEIPAVFGADNITTRIADSDVIIVDGNSGDILVNPDADIMDEYAEKRDSVLNNKKILHQFTGE